tara:strand:+ start:209 stop:490 length:282 start_codon:yes stop_codon:yes gene_type:complete
MIPVLRRTVDMSTVLCVLALFFVCFRKGEEPSGRIFEALQRAIRTPKRRSYPCAMMVVPGRIKDLRAAFFLEMVQGDGVGVCFERVFGDFEVP